MSFLRLQERFSPSCYTEFLQAAKITRIDRYQVPDVHRSMDHFLCETTGGIQYVLIFGCV